MSKKLRKGKLCPYKGDMRVGDNHCLHHCDYCYEYGDKKIICIYEDIIDNGREEDN